VAFLFCVERWAAEPAGEKLEQGFIGTGQALGVDAARGIGFGQLVHQFVEAVDEAVQACGAAEGFVGCDSSGVD